MKLLISARSQATEVVNSVECDLDVPATFGRGLESVLLLDGTGISREHFRLHLEGNAALITDLSTNGTWLNGKRLTPNKPQRFTFGDEISVPGFRIRVDPQEQPITRGESPTRSKGGPETPQPAGNSGDIFHRFVTSFSFVEKALIFLALMTLTAVALYFFSS